jgi:Mg2+/Co2+ transporter CorB
MMESTYIMDLLIIIGCLVISAFFSASETALTAVSRARIFSLSQSGNAAARRVERLREKKDAMIGTILLGNNFVNIAAASVGTVVFVEMFGPEWGAFIATSVMTVAILIFSEVLPKTVAIHHAESVSLHVVRPLGWVVRILWPLTRLVQMIVWAILRLFGVRENVATSFTAAMEAIRGAIELHHSEGVVVKEDRDMLGSILDLNERELEEIMVHRSQVFSLDLALEPEEIISRALASVHSRIPLWQGEQENIIGVLHIKDLMQLARQQKIGLTREMIRRVASRPWFVPETTTLADQLLAFRNRRKHFACVVDEYGVWKGIVTLEDIIEEIVGEIGDEHDPVLVADIIPFGTAAYRVAGTVTIRDINRQLEWKLPDEHATTVAGLVLHESRTIPDPGAVFEFHGYRFTVAEKKGRQLAQLIVEPVSDDNGDTPHPGL